MERYEAIHRIIDIGNNEVQSWNIDGSCSIHRVPKFLRQGGENEYVPQIVSIGPFHRSKKSLQAMNNNKQNYLREVISWTKKNGSESDSGEIMNKYLNAIQSVERKARECYSEPINLNSNNFVEMMVIDGCFIINLLCKVGRLIRADCDDPIFGMSWLRSKLRKDLLMLENQIPFIVLQKLFDQMVLNNHDCLSLVSLAFDFFRGLVPNIEMSIKEKKPKHLLHLFQSSLVPTVKEDKQCKKNDREANNFDLIQSVKALKYAGIKFKKAKEAKSFFDVKFNKGTLEIPPVLIHGATNSLFLNLIAFEQCYSACTNHFTDYTAFMYCMINTATDVQTLCKSGIIENWLGNDNEVANLFKMLGKAVTVSTSEFYLSNVFSEITQYKRSTCSACMVSLKRFYSNSFWSIFPFGLAVIFLVLTFVQTYVAVYTYLHPSPPK